MSIRSTPLRGGNTWGHLEARAALWRGVGVGTDAADISDDGGTGTRDLYQLHHTALMLVQRSSF